MPTCNPEIAIRWPMPVARNTCHSGSPIALWSPTARARSSALEELGPNSAPIARAIDARQASTQGPDAAAVMRLSRSART